MLNVQACPGAQTRDGRVHDGKGQRVLFMWHDIGDLEEILPTVFKPYSALG